MRSIKSKLVNRSAVPYLLIFPAFIVVFSIAAYCIVWLLRMSMSSWRFGAPMNTAEFVGLKNYLWLLTSKESIFFDSVKITGVYIAACMTVELVLGMLIALLFAKIKFGRSVYTATMLIPMVLMPTMVGLISRLYFYDKGLINYIIEIVSGTRINWYSTEYALLAAILVDIWEYTPFFIIILLAGIQSLPADIYEAAIVDGSGKVRTFFYITLPLLAPLVYTAIVLRLMDMLRIFDVIYAMFSGGPGTATTTLPLLVYRQTMVARNVGAGSAASMVLIFIITCMCLVLVRLFEKSRIEN